MAIDLNTASALETAAAVRSGEVSALEVTDAAIARVEAGDSQINAVPVHDFDRARKAARAVDDSRLPDDRRRLLGVAMTLKESNDVAGLPSTWGLTEHRDNIAARDGVIASRLKAAGAVIIGKTNVPPALADWQSDNDIYGRTLNPHDLTRTPGGSSGGSAAALAAGFVPAEIGTDIGGSIRIPAHFCGVMGHKPTYGIVPLYGHEMPGTNGKLPPLSVAGPLARTAEDLEGLLDVVAGPVEAGLAINLPRMSQASLKNFRVLVLSDHPGAGVDASVAGPIDDLADALAREGATVTRDASVLPDLADMHRDYLIMLNTTLQRRSGEPSRLSAFDWLDLEDTQLRTQRAWADAFRNVDIVLSPPLGVPAFTYKEGGGWADRTLTVNGEETPYGAQLVWPGMALFANLPATIAPIAMTNQGVPTSVQIIGPAYGDRTTIGFARLLEQAGLSRSYMAG